MITASHNPVADNGLKMVDGDGGMLAQSWELVGAAHTQLIAHLCVSQLKFCCVPCPILHLPPPWLQLACEVANAQESAVASVLQSIRQREGISATGGAVYIAKDTRPSSRVCTMPVLFHKGRS